MAKMYGSTAAGEAEVNAVLSEIEESVEVVSRQSSPALKVAGVLCGAVAVVGAVNMVGTSGSSLLSGASFKALKASDAPTIDFQAKNE